jgi:hypothetical protein
MMGRLLDNRWVSRAGNVSFVVGAVVFLIRLASGWSPLTIVTVLLIAIGVVLMGLSHRDRLMRFRRGRRRNVGLDEQQARAVARSKGLNVRDQAENLLTRGDARRVTEAGRQNAEAIRAQKERVDAERASLAAAVASLHFSLRYLMDRSLIISVTNDGSTITDALLNVLAPMRPERQYLYRMEGGSAMVKTGATDQTPHELLPGYPTALRWSEAHLEIYGQSTTEWSFFLPRYEGDPVYVRVGADALGGWTPPSIFITPPDDEMLMKHTPVAEAGQPTTEVLLTQGDDAKRSAECAELIRRGHWFKNELTNPNLASTLNLTQTILHGDFRSTVSRWCIDVRGFIDAYVVTEPENLLPEQREGELVAAWTTDAVLELVEAHLDVLRTVKRSIPTRAG